MTKVIEYKLITYDEAIAETVKGIDKEISDMISRRAGCGSCLIGSYCSKKYCSYAKAVAKEIRKSIKMFK